MPSETIESTFDFAFYMSFSIIILLLFLPLTQNLYNICIESECKTMATTIKRVGEELEENMTVKVTLVNNIDQEIILETLGNRITLYTIKGKIITQQDSNITFYDTTIKLGEYMSISKIRGKVIVRGA